MLLSSILFSLLLGLTVSAAASIKGRLVLPDHNITRDDLRRTSFRVYQIGNYSTPEPYTAVTKLKDLEGNFEFDNLPVNTNDVNETTYFVLYPSSLDYNLRPNRILIEFTNMENGTLQMKGYKNFFGREYFPSKNIVHPERLQEAAVEPYVKVSAVKEAPRRMYVQERTAIAAQNNPLLSFINAPWKVAVLLVVGGLLALPTIVEKLDPEAAKMMRERALEQKKQRYAAAAAAAASAPSS